VKVKKTQSVQLKVTRRFIVILEYQHVIERCLTVTYYVVRVSKVEKVNS